jgi:hypothetical protein
MASNGQKWAQIPQRLHRTGSKTGFFSPALSLELELLVAGMRQLYISGSFGEHNSDVFTRWLVRPRAEGLGRL